MTRWLDDAGVIDPEERRKALLLHTVLIAALALNLVSFTLLTVFGTDLVASVVGHGIAGLAEAAGIVAVRRGHTRTASHGVIAVLMVLMVGMAFAYGGMLGTVPFVAITVVVMAYYLLGVRSGLTAASSLLACGVAMVVLHPWLPAVPAQSPAGNLASFVVTVGLVSAVVHAAIVRAERFAAERQEALERQERAEHRIRQILETMREGVVVVGSTGAVTSTNPAAEGLFGRSAPELIGTSFAELLAGDGETELPSFAAVDRIEAEIRSSAASAPVPVMVSMSRGESGQTVVVLSDVSEIKEAQRAQADAARAAREASTTKSQFLANMSHELRTPLNAILGYSEMLQEEVSDPDQVSDVQRIHRAGRHLLGLINDVLDLSKIEAGKMEVVRERLDLDRLLEEVRVTSLPLAKRSGAQLELESDGDLGAVWTDGQRLRQVLLNLVSNACKFSPDGEVTLRATRETSDRGDAMVFDVIDNGIGISKEQMSRLFQPFTQADASTSRKFGGTGLGLVLSRRFTEMLGGTIEVESELGSGSRFTVRLPVKRLTESTTTPLPRADDRPVVLCIDDDPDGTALLVRMLARAGFRAIEARSGEEGLALARSERPAAITLDIQLPGMDGWAVLAELKQEPELARVPVVVVTVVDDERRGYVLGAHDYLVKPVNQPRLHEALAAITGSTGTALVVEDDPDTRGLLVRHLEDVGWTALAAEHGQAALDLLEQAEVLPDVVLLDVMMPVMDGFETSERLRADERFASIPILVLSALDLTTEDRTRLGTDRALRKSEVELSEVVSEVQRLARPMVN